MYSCSVSNAGGTTTSLTATLTVLFTKEQKDTAIAAAEAAKDAVITARDQTITDLNATIAAMFTQTQLDQAAATAEAAKDAVIAARGQTITERNATIEGMFTQEQLDAAVSGVCPIAMATASRMHRKLREERTRINTQWSSRRAGISSRWAAFPMTTRLPLSSKGTRSMMSGCGTPETDAMGVPTKWSRCAAIGCT